MLRLGAIQNMIIKCHFSEWQIRPMLLGDGTLVVSKTKDKHE